MGGLSRVSANHASSTGHHGGGGGKFQTAIAVGVKVLFERFFSFGRGGKG